MNTTAGCTPGAHRSTLAHSCDPAGMGLMIQDLTPANLLVDDGPEGMRLLFSDPAMAQPIKLLRQR